MLEMEKNPDNITTKLGKRIVQIRKEKGIKQVDLAVFVNIDDSSLRKIESGRTNPTTRTLEKIAHALGVSIKDLFDFE